MEEIREPNNLLRHEREKRGWSQSRLAELIGTDTSMISRWERGARKPDPFYREKLCTLFGKDAIELGFINTQPKVESSHPNTTQEATRIERRTVVQGILGFTGVTLVASNELLNPDTLERLLRALKKPSHLDETTLSHLNDITKHYWQMFASTTGLTRYHLLGGLSGHLQTLTGLLEYSLPTEIQNHLCVLSSETAQIIGEILFDINESNAAEAYYNAAIEAAKNAQHSTLQAVVLGRKSFIPVYGENPQQAITLLHQAHHLASYHAPDITHAWLSALEAEAHANNHDAYSCYKALEQSEYSLERVKPGETGYARPGESEYARFSNTVLLGYKGVCYVRLHEPEAARKALLESIALMGDTRLRHKSITLVDLAMTYVQQGEINEAYSHAEQALAIMTQTRSPRTFERVLDLRRELEQWKNEQAVKNLDEQITTLRPSVVLWRR